MDRSVNVVLGAIRTLTPSATFMLDVTPGAVRTLDPAASAVPAFRGGAEVVGPSARTKASPWSTGVGPRRRGGRRAREEERRHEQTTGHRATERRIDH